jgi:hypothetical protein
VVWCRFLRARKFDVPKAKAMLLSAEQWRKDEKVDELARCVIFFLLIFPSIFLLHNDEHFLPCERGRLLNPILFFLVQNI